MSDPVTDLTTSETGLETVVQSLLTALQALFDVSQKEAAQITLLTNELASSVNNAAAVEALVLKFNAVSNNLNSEITSVNTAIAAAQAVLPTS